MNSKKRKYFFDRRKVVIIGGIFILLLLVLTTVVPWIMGVVTDARHVYLESVPEENRGVYLLTDQGVMQLYDWQIPLAELPSDAPVLNANSLQNISILMKQLASPEAYDLYNMITGDSLSWQGSWREGRQLYLDPGSLPAGDYMLVIPTDDLFKENTFHYFKLR